MEVWNDLFSSLTILYFLFMIPAAMTVHCYSCMAKTLGTLWKDAGLDEIFVEPVTFSDSCRRPDRSRQAPFLRQCTSTCITMLIELSFGMGAKTHIRGCYDSIFVNGFNELNAGRFKTHELCQRFNLSQLVSTPGQHRRAMHDSILEVCSCHGRLCNGGFIALSTAAQPVSPCFALICTCLIISTILLLVRGRTGVSYSCITAAIVIVWAILDFDNREAAR